ncbi:efflux transporter outer membrane subunit [Ramlibacter sp. H39-3-26]|uniref:efflux transporter outer membrane subunit n=1 Tax=Curvibacter soli TaxID=3031331 RepID=UPI0023DAB244|nr:efflux transporter outer membrane subunit [Ramlibacter sp. H39-3-26]MDF1485146.1 efflux transporter outer membrane subunit [Ramlibacter sp. H39-3-26]
MKARHSAWRAAALAAAWLAAGCANLAPGYVQPAAPVPAAWQSAVPRPGALAAPVPDLTVQDFFIDPRLRGVVELALSSNRDLRVAALNIERARAQYGIQRASLLPAINATGAASRTRTAEDVSSNGIATTQNAFSANAGLASWEIDFFGRLRNLDDAALETFLATTETRRSTQISLVADTATAWLTLAADQRRLRLARETLQSQQASYELTRRAHAVGAESGLTLAQARTTVDAARADVAGYTRAVAQDRNALALLAGAAVPEALLPPADDDSAAQAAALVAVPEGLPSDLLQSRPDVLAAEHTLRGANANIGAARAAFFPRITLTAQAGSASRDLDRLFAGGNGAWTFAPQIVLPIFSAGALQASLDVAEITRDINVAQYEKTLQTAFREVADALAARATVDEQLAAQRSLRDTSATALELSQARYRTGVDSYLDVQVAQRSLYSAGQTLITLQLAEQVNRLTLYKVMGGGWQQPEPAGAAQAAPQPAS